MLTMLTMLTMLNDTVWRYVFSNCVRSEQIPVVVTRASVPLLYSQKVSGLSPSSLLIIRPRRERESALYKNRNQSLQPKVIIKK